MQSTSGSPSQRIPTLDGWRGVAILMVLITHAQAGLWGRAWRYNWMAMGQHGVGIFFVLSGFLITSRLLAQEQIDLREFYIRRFFRLMPTAWLYLLLVLAFSTALRLHVIGRDIWPCVLFFRNYYGAEGSTNAMTSHFWSLSVEEQFYLFWPAVLVLAGRRRALHVAITGALLCAAYRFAFWASLSGTRHTETGARIDALLVGCAFALALQSESLRAKLTEYAPVLIGMCLPLLVVCVVRYQTLIPLSESVIIGLLLAATSVAPQSWLGRLLEYRHLAFVGSISYSLYVWQEFFLVPHWGALAPVMMAFLPLAAVLNHGLVERPLIDFGRRLSRPRASVAPQSAVGQLAID